MDYALIAAGLALALFALLVTVNWRVGRGLRADLPRGRGTRLLIVLWALPFLGALIAMIAARPREPGTSRRGSREGKVKVVEQEAPAQLVIAGLPPLDLDEYMPAVLGLPLPAWPGIKAWAAPLGAAAQTPVIDAARRAWLLRLRDVLGEEFRLHESEHTYLLSSLEPVVAQAMAQFVSTTRKRIAHVLDGVARFNPGEKSIVLVFDDEEDYYEYVTLYYPEEGEFAFSGGMFINAGCPHFVVRRADLSLIEPTIAHELTHSAVNHLRLPRWLDEGLAVNTEERLTRPMPRLHTPAQMRRKHLAYWGEEQIQQFWSGHSFFRSDDGNMLSYDLARTLVAQMGRDWHAFTRFVASARHQDGGLAAAREVLKVDLTAFVCGVLDREPDPAWAPDPDVWAAWAELDERPEDKEERQQAAQAARKASFCD